MTRQHSDITIRPEPTDEELAVIVAAIEMIDLESGIDSPPRAISKSRWTEVARRESLRTELRDS